MTHTNTAQPMFILPQARIHTQAFAYKKMQPLKSRATQALEMFSFSLVLCGLYGLLVAG